MANNWHPAVAAQSREERKFRTDQVAAILGCSERWVRQLCEDKLLAGTKMGRRKWLIKESAIREYVNRLNQE